MSSQSQVNPFLLASENSSGLIPLLRSNSSLASSQDDHGYSLLHAATSYNHLDLLRTLVSEFKVDVNLEDEDGETALFVTETVECAKVLVEELHINIISRGDDGKTAGEKIAEEGDFPDVAVYLRIKELECTRSNGVPAQEQSFHPPPLPEGVSVNIGALTPEELGEVADPEFRMRIEELASREDFQGEQGQMQLRELVTEAVRGEVGQEREVRQRVT